MRDHERGGAAVCDDILHALLAFLAEVAVADGEYLVKDYHVGLDHARNGECDTGFHARRERAEGAVLKLTHIGKVDYLVVFAVDKFLGVA